MPKGGCTYHHRMDSRVDKDEHPDRGGHVAHASPHAHHGAGMVVGLERGAHLALCQDDEGIKDLVEFAQIKDPAVKGQALVPDAAQIRPARGSITRQGDIVRI